MCGIAGFMNVSKDLGKVDLKNRITAMTDSLGHRGPDDKGVWVDQENGIGLGHRRLSILDLSKSGAQPMKSASGRYQVVYNGEIYNFPSLKRRLSEKGHKFKGTSDTEVLLACTEEWGIKKALQEMNGMFAFALWDNKDSVLHLARDRMGKKPLYYGWSGKSFLFASELKALRAYSEFKPEINRAALTSYVSYNYIPVPQSIYKGIHKLSAASFMTITSNGNQKDPAPYWDLDKIAASNIQNPLTTSYEDALEELEQLLKDAVKRRMIADVPLGSFLSGGIDSSLVTALMQKLSGSPVKTFSIGFEEAGYNEAPAAKKIADYLGTDHTEYYLSAKETRAVIPQIPQIYDEPFADPSQIPTYHVSHLARKSVTVALSGDGGDEGFAGYGRYHTAQRIGRPLLMIPYPLRGMMAQILGAMPVKGRVRKLSEMLNAKNQTEFYRMLMSYWQKPYVLVKNSAPAPDAMSDHKAYETIKDFMNKMMLMDMKAYLADDILVKVDRASMATSLEVRAPLLDYTVIEYAWRVPLSMKVKEQSGKHILKDILARHIPRELFERPKQGFGIPHGEWIKGPLQDWAENLLDENRIKTEEFFHADIVRKIWQEHRSGAKNWSYQLWGLLMFQAWHDHWK